MFSVEALENDLSKSVVRLCNLSIKLEGDCIFIAGSTKSYYQKQIALHIITQHVKETKLKFKENIKVS